MRINILKDLIEFKEPIPSLKKKLSSYPWDSVEILIVSRSDVTRIVERYLNGKLQESEVAGWADAIEVRDDLGYEIGHEEILKKFFIETANPDLFGSLNTDKAKTWIDLLK